MDKTLFGLEARRDARESVKHPGKFEGNAPITVILYNLVMQGSWSDESYESDSNWMERIGKRLVCGDDQGFVWSVNFKNPNAAQEVFEAQSKLWDAVAGY